MEISDGDIWTEVYEMTTESKYLLDYDAYVNERPDEVQAAWEAQYKALMEDKDHAVYTFIMQYIFM